MKPMLRERLLLAGSKKKVISSGKAKHIRRLAFDSYPLSKAYSGETTKPWAVYDVRLWADSYSTKWYGCCIPISGAQERTGT
jgi:hypothetical protein